MDNLNRLIDFLERLDKFKIYYRLSKIRESILVEIAVPGERWEVEFMADGEIVIEKFKSDGQLQGEYELNLLFKKFSD
jgi:hypothetical protein